MGGNGLVPLSEIAPGQWLFFDKDGHCEYGVREKYDDDRGIPVGHDHIWTSYLPPDTLVYPCSHSDARIPRAEASAALFPERPHSGPHLQRQGE